MTAHYVNGLGHVLHPLPLTLAEEASRYLAAVDVFRAAGHEPTYRAEEETVRCYCPDDCNCRKPWRFNYCGCKQHEEEETVNEDAYEWDEQSHPDSPLIDGAMPYSGAERVAILLDYAATLIGERGMQATEPGLRLERLFREHRDASAQEIPQPPLVHPANEFEHWNEIEDDAMALISDLLPEPWYCTLHSDDPGTVVIWQGEDE